MVPTSPVPTVNDSGINPMAQLLSDWLAARTKPGRQTVLVSNIMELSRIESIPHARDLDDSHVDHLVHSFQRTATVNKNVTFVLYGCKYVDEEDPWCHTLLDLSEGSKGSGPLAGQHTVPAIAELNRRYPKNPLWKNIEFDLVICDDGEEATGMIEAAGLRSNFIAGTFKSPTFKDTIDAMHRTYEQEFRHFECIRYAVPSSDACSAIKLRFSNFTNMTVRYVEQLWAMAKRRGQVWDQMKLIIDGKYKPAFGSKAKPCESSSHFNTMAKVPAHVLSEFLSNVQEGRWSLGDFRSRCLLWKAEKKLRGLILEHMQEKGVIGSNQGWDDLQEKYPVIDQDFIDTWVTVSMKGKYRKVMPPKLKTRLNDIISAKKKNKQVCFLSLILLSR